MRRSVLLRLPALPRPRERLSPTRAARRKRAARLRSGGHHRTNACVEAGAPRACRVPLLLESRSTSALVARELGHRATLFISAPLGPSFDSAGVRYEPPSRAADRGGPSGGFFGGAVTRPVTRTAVPGFASASTPCAMKNQNACNLHFSSETSRSTISNRCRRPGIGTIEPLSTIAANVARTGSCVASASATTSRKGRGNEGRPSLREASGGDPRPSGSPCSASTARVGLRPGKIGRQARALQRA